MRRSIAAALLLLAASVNADARDRPFIDEPDPKIREDLPEVPEWSEGGYALPPYPDDDDLVEFSVDDPGSPFRYFLDAASLSIGEDEVVRYTVVIRSPSGGNNVSYEGIRCNERLAKVYAYGSGRGKFHPVPGAKWQPTHGSRAAPHHKDLREFYFCVPNQHIPYEADDILRNLRIRHGRGGDPATFYP